MKRILIVGIEYTGPSIDGVEIENLGLCRSEVSKERSAYCLYDYDTIIINPQSYTHFIFGKEGTHSNSQNELSALKRENNDYDLDTVFDYSDRSNELEAAIDNGATVIWCLAPSKREQFYGYRTTDIAYLNKKISSAIKSGGLVAKRGRTIKRIDPNSPFKEYFESLKTSG